VSIRLPGAQYAVRSLSVGTFEEPGYAVFWMASEPAWVSLRLQLILIEGAGIKALVNTALPDDLDALRADLPAMMWGREGAKGAIVRSPAELQSAALAAAGVTPAEITHLILTPIVRYTTETLDAFPNAQIAMSKAGWIHFHTTHRHPHDSRKSFSERDLVHLVTDWWPRVRLLEDEDELAPGLRTWQCGVHHRSTLVVEVDTPDGVVAISDAWFVYENVEGEHWRPLGLNESFEETFRTNARALRTADHLVPLYDHRVFERYPGGIISRGPSTP
jgi:hypothetical protein